MIRTICVLFLLVLFLGVDLCGQSPDTKIKSAVDKQKEAEEDLKKLEIKMRRIAEKLEEIHPYYAEKLLQALDMMKRDLMADDIREMITLLENRIVGRAISKGEEIKEELEVLLDFLQDRMGIRDVEKKIKELESLMREANKIKNEQQKVLEETKKVNPAENKKINELIDDIDKSMILQEILKNELTRPGVENTKQKIEQSLKKIDDLIKKQKDLIKETDESEKNELRQLGDFIDKLDSIIFRQSNALEENRAFQKNKQSLRDAINKLDNIIAAQETIRKQDFDNMNSRDLENFAQQQEDIGKHTAKVGVILGDIDLEQEKTIDTKTSLFKAIQISNQASQDLADESFQPAKEEQGKVLDRLNQARSEIEKLLDNIGKTEKAKLDHLSQEQMKMGVDVNKLADSMKSASESSEQDAMKEVLNEASAQSSSAANNMNNAKENFDRNNAKDADMEQTKALNDLKDAKQTLGSLQEQLARPDQDKFKDIADKQKQINEEVDSLLNTLESVVDQMQSPDYSDKARRGADEAFSSVSQSSRSMSKAQDGLSKNNPRSAKRNQTESVGFLEDAKKSLRDLKKQLESLNDKERIKKISQAQKELADKTKKLAEKIKNAKSDVKYPDDLDQASNSVSKASSEMSNASKSMQGGSQSQQQAKANQNKAQDNLSNAKDVLERLKKRSLTEKEKRKLERLARRQKEIEEMTKKLAEEAKKRNEQNAEQTAENAANNMKSASQSMSQGNAQGAQENEEEAMRNLERMYEELAQKKQSLDEQQKNQMLEKLDQMLTRIIKKQQEISDETVRLEQIKINFEQKELPRQEIVNLKKIAQSQGELVKETNKVNDKLLEENSSVFSWILKTIQEDMILVEELLRDEQRTDKYTQSVQRDILRKLKELLDALKKEKARMKSGGQKKSGSGSQMSNKLLPNIAELKMLRTMQKNLLDKTREFKNNNVNENTRSFDRIQKKILQRLSAEQLHLSDLTEEFIGKLKEEYKKMKQQEMVPGE